MTEAKSADERDVFDIGVVDLELRREDAYVRTGHTARTLVREADLRVILVAMKAGSRIAEHRADETATIHVLSGRLRLRLPSRLVDLSTCQLLVLERAVPHDVDGVEETRFLLTLGWKNRP